MEIPENNLRKLIRYYFKRTSASVTQARFMAWLLDDSRQKEKEQAMLELWDQDAASADLSTLDELNLMHDRIRKHTKRRWSWRQVLAGVGALLLLPMLGAMATYYAIHKPATPTKAKVELVEYFAPQGERRRIVLSDSSEVWLNAGSMLVCTKQFDADSRTLYLSGEANFKVTKDAHRPFTVKTSYVDVEALGTTFNVEAYGDMDRTTTSLEEGSVQVRTKDGSQTMVIAPNEQAIYHHQTKQISKNSVDAVREARWKDGYMVFQASSFMYIMKTLERKFNINIYYEARKYDSRYYTVRFAPDENLLQVMDILTEMIPGLTYKVKDRTVYIN